MKTEILGSAEMFCTRCQRVTRFTVRRHGALVAVICSSSVAAYAKHAREGSVATLCLHRIREPTRVAVAVARARTREPEL
jgi:hypothetical protein